MYRIASHRILDACTSCLSAFQIVERQVDGTFSLSPFSEEIRHTEWLPGLVILSPFEIIRHEGEGYASFVSRLSEEADLWMRLRLQQEEDFTRCMAYWVTPFDVSHMEFLPHSQVKCLCDF